MVHRSRKSNRALHAVGPQVRDEVHGVRRSLSRKQARVVTSDQLLAVLGGLLGGAAVAGGAIGFEFGRRKK